MTTSAFTGIFDDDGGGGSGPRLGVKASMDVAGAVTTFGSPAFAGDPPSDTDAPVVATARAAGARLVGHTAMPEFGFNATGINPWYGTPENPLDPERVPGGSSTGAVVGLARGDFDVAFGTDAGGSCRIPPACSGVAGLKTTHGRLPLDGIRPLAPSLDVVGPLGRDLDGLVATLRLLEPGFDPADAPPRRVGRLRTSGEPDIEAAVDAVLAGSGLAVVDVELDLVTGYRAGTEILLAEAWRHLGHLLDRQPEQLGDDVTAKLTIARQVTDERVAAARRDAERFAAAVDAALEGLGALVLPTIPTAPPPLDADRADIDLSRFTIAFNASGHPALALPVPRDGPLPASLQLVGRRGGEADLVGLGRHLEAAGARGPFADGWQR